MTYPRPNRKTLKRVTDNVFVAEGEHHGVGHEDFPGGCGVGPSLWRYLRTGDDVYQRRISKLFRRYDKLRRMGVAQHNIHLAPLQDNNQR